jgi:hypothetical protein
MINFKYYKPTQLISFIILLGALIGFLSQYSPTLNNIPDFISIPSSSALIGFLIFSIDKWFWKFKIFGWLVDVPNISGKYEGYIRYKNPINGYEGELECIINIRQTSSNVVVSSFFKNLDGTNSTQSKSKIANIIKDEDNIYQLIFTYDNSGTPGSEKFPPHYGTNVLKLIVKNNEKILSGYYYTNRNPQTKGEMYIKHKENNIYDEF